MSRALIASGLKIPSKGEMGILLADEKSELGAAKELVGEFKRAGIDFATTEAVSPFLGEGVKVASVGEMLEMIGKGKVAMVISLNTNLNRVRKDLYKVRRKAVERQVPFLTTVEEGKAVLLCVRSPLRRLS